MLIGAKPAKDRVPTGHARVLANLTKRFPGSDSPADGTLDFFRANGWPAAAITKFDHVYALRP